MIAKFVNKSDAIQFMQRFERIPYMLVECSEELLDVRIGTISCLQVHNNAIVVEALNLMHDTSNIAVVSNTPGDVVRLLLRSPGTGRTIGHHCNRQIGHTAFAMDKLHDIIHTQVASHTIIALAINQVTGRWINPASTNYGGVRIRFSRLQISFNTTLAITSNNPT